jgi:hypothetical protein
MYICRQKCGKNGPSKGSQINIAHIIIKTNSVEAAEGRMTHINGWN